MDDVNLEPINIPVPDSPRATPVTVTESPSTYSKASKSKPRRDLIPKRNDTGAASSSGAAPASAGAASATAVAVPKPRTRPRRPGTNTSSAPSTPLPKIRKAVPDDPQSTKKQRTKRGAEKRKGLAVTAPSQADALDLAYTSPTRMFATQKVVFIPGTDIRDMDDLQDDKLVMEGKVRETKRYKYMRRMIAKLPYKPIAFVGHSLGAAIARALGEDLGIPHTGYEDPTPTWERGEPGNFRSKWDVLTLQNMGAITSEAPTLDPHGYRAKARLRSVTLLPQQPDDL